MKVAVTGGTGFVGSTIVRELVERGHDVRVLSRGVHKGDLNAVQGPGSKVQREQQDTVGRVDATYIKGDVTTGEGMDELLVGRDALIHLVGIIREKGSNTFEAAHHRAAVNALETAGRHGVRRVLHMSALGARKDAVSRYHKTKWKGEEAVRASGLSWTIFRPSIIFGPGGSFVNLLASLMRKTPVVFYPGSGENLMQPVSVQDVARSFADSLEKESTSGRVLELGGPKIYKFKQLLNIIAEVINKKRLFIGIPSVILLPAVRVSDALKLSVPLSADQLIMLGEDNVVSDPSGMELLGFEFTEFSEGIGEYL